VSRPPPAPGLFDALRRLLATGLGIAQVRLELFGTELEAEKLRLFDALWRLALAMLLLGVSLVLGLGFVLLLFQEGYRLAAVGVLTLACAGGGAWLLSQARQAIASPKGGAFALSLGELRSDRDGLLPAQTTGEVTPVRPAASQPMP
jgi:uncharacterized membrane protein YqjE